MDPRDSVITHTKNKADHVSSAIQSVLGRIVEDFEIIVVSRYCECRDIRQARKESIEAITNSPFSIINRARLFASFLVQKF